MKVAGSMGLLVALTFAMILSSGCDANPMPGQPSQHAGSSAPLSIPDAPVSFMGLADNGQYAGVNITGVTEMEVRFTTLDGTFGVRSIDEIPRIVLRGNSHFIKAEELLAADKFVDAAAEYKASLPRQSGGDLKMLIEGRLRLAERFAKEGRPKPQTQPASKPVTENSKTMVIDLGNKVTMKLVLIPAGKFKMGSPENEWDRRGNEGPEHVVTVTKPFYMGICEVTQEQYWRVIGPRRPRVPDDASMPAETSSWDEAIEFCRKLSATTGRTVTLPTEAQWEYACRANSTTRFSYGDDKEYDNLGDYAWFAKNSEKKAHPVGLKKPNEWGLYDMHGNVWEWCADWYGEDYYNGMYGTDPAGPASGIARVVRGGCWYSESKACRSAYRDGCNGGIIGFRVVVELK